MHYESQTQSLKPQLAGFDGCISSISYDGVSLPLYDEPFASSPHYVAVTQRNIASHCTDSGVTPAASRMVIG